MRRTVRLWGGTVAVTLVLAAGCAQGTSAPPRGPRHDATSSAWPNASARPAGDIIETGLVVGREELVLALTGSTSVLTVWRDTKTAAIRQQPDGGGASWGPCKLGPSLQHIVQIVAKDGRLVDVGVAKGNVGGVSVEHGGTQTDASIAGWSMDRSVVLFWAIRDGSPVTATTAEADLPAYVVKGKDGKQLDRQVFTAVCPRQDG
ncbi:hypothetical protein AB0M46_07250 [Dactylosporangium sp. NPDC051485]|uniref:hypothetical protein n=1 Tax=Dactylosporangium sp. NPDC051485 TaxID=3154846 RepID=UPI00341CBCC2